MRLLSTLPVPDSHLCEPVYLSIELDCLEGRFCRVAVRRGDDGERDSVECDCRPQRGVRVDGKLCGGVVLLEGADDLRIEYGSEHASFRFVSNRGIPASLSIRTSAGTNVRTIDAAEFEAGVGQETG